jgi:hypothetical protein
MLYQATEGRRSEPSCRSWIYTEAFGKDHPAAAQPQQLGEYISTGRYDELPLLEASRRPVKIARRTTPPWPNLNNLAVLSATREMMMRNHCIGVFEIRQKHFAGSMLP